uniref:Uncharacterized protein n=1 Tax=Arundo donax TaxID=35708 RepID=A0A0A8XQ76_ARUDO
MWLGRARGGCEEEDMQELSDDLCAPISKHVEVKFYWTTYVQESPPVGHPIDLGRPACQLISCLVVGCLRRE